MKKLSMIFFTFTIIVASQTFGQSFNQPESIVFDYENLRWLISNKAGGTILQQDLDGNLDYFAEGLDNPKGITIYNNTLFVNENSSIKGFDLTVGVETYNFDIAGATFLNDIVSDGEGHLYTSGSNSSKIYKIYIPTVSYSVFTDVSSSPNGLLMDKMNNRILLCYFSANSPIDAINLSDSSLSTVTSTSLSNLDGFARNKQGDIFVSSWGSNAIHRFDAEFMNPPDMVIDGLSGPADIFIETQSDILAIPEYNGNAITFKTSNLGGSLISVPDDQSTIQAAIDAAEEGDIVLVNSGTYNENLNYKGKNINVSSRYIFNNDPEYITNTIIDGENPVHPDTASCVLFVNGETEAAIIQGFTITGGAGTKWLDEHGAGLFTEGGGILMQYASPTIKNNKIMFNAAVDLNGTVSAGGGAIRCGDSNPLIENNLIAHNQGRYGGGIVLNYSGAVIRNNIIDHNSGGEDYGGGGIWMVGSAADPKILTNNTITNNHSESTAGGIRIWSAVVEISNSIIWGNTAGSAPQIQGNGGVFSYCDIEGGWSGEQNIEEFPMFDDLNFYLMTGSPCIDAGNPDVSFNDPEDPANPGQAKFPSMGNLRNDIGAYGGPHRQIIVDYLTGVEENKIETLQEIDFSIYPNPCSGFTKILISVPDQSNLPNGQINVSCELYQISGIKVKTLLNEAKLPGEFEEYIDLRDIPTGAYFCTLKTDKITKTAKLIKMD